MNYPTFRSRLPMCLGMAHVNRKGKIIKTGLFNWVTSGEQYQSFIEVIESQLKELNNNEAFFYNKLLKIEKEIGLAENKDSILSPTVNTDTGKTEKEIELLKKEKEQTSQILKTIKEIEKDTKNMWLITIEARGKTQKIKKIAKIDEILKGVLDGKH